MEKLRNILESFDYEIVEQCNMYEYTLLLMYDKNEMMYEISMTSKERDFTTAKLQSKILSNHSNRKILETSRIFINKIKEWLNEYQILSLDSLNKNKAYKYHKILKNNNTRITDICDTTTNINFPEYWEFKIYKL